MELVLLILGTILVLSIIGIRLLAWRVKVEWTAAKNAANCPSCRYDGASITSEGRCVECGHTRAESLERLGRAPVWPLAVILAPAVVLATLPPGLFPEWSTATHAMHLVAALVPAVMLALIAWRTRIARFSGLTWTFVLVPSLLINAAWGLRVSSHLRLSVTQPGLSLRQVEAVASVAPYVHLAGTAACLGLFYCVTSWWFKPRT